MDLYEDYLRERQQRLDLAEKTMRGMKGDELAEEIAGLLGSNPGSDYVEFVDGLRKQPATRFLVGRFEERGYYALDPDAGKGFWMGEWNEGGVKGRGVIGAPAMDSLMQAAQRRGLV
jgi:hypothetical protein